MNLWRLGVGFVKCVMFDWFDCTRQWRPSWCSLGLGKCGWPPSSHSIHNSTSRILIVLCISCIPSPLNNFLFFLLPLNIYSPNWSYSSIQSTQESFRWKEICVECTRCSLNNTVCICPCIRLCTFLFLCNCVCLCPCLCLSVMWYGWWNSRCGEANWSIFTADVLWWKSGFPAQKTK